jgi:hypothetical protein
VKTQCPVASTLLPLSQMQAPIRSCPSMQSGGGGSLDAVDASGGDVGAADGAAGPVA